MMTRERLSRWLGIALQGDHQFTSPDHPREGSAWSVTIEEAEILGRYAQDKDVLEIGTGLGVSTWGMALTAKKVDTVDPDPWVLSALHFPANVRQFASVELLESPYDMAFIDGLHDFESVKLDILAVLQRLHPGGCIAFHDYGQTPVAEAIDRAFPREGYHRDEYPTIGHLTIVSIG